MGRRHGHCRRAEAPARQGAGEDKSAEALAINSISEKKVALQSISDVIKAALAFDKKRARKAFASILEKVHTMRISGVTTDMVPPCLAAYPIYASVFTNACDQRWPECLSVCKRSSTNVELGVAARGFVQ